MPKHRLRCLLPLFLSLASSMTPAQERLFPEDGSAVVPLPNAEELAKAQNRARDVMGRIPPADAPRPPYAATGMPQVEALPKPGVPAPDIATLAEKFKSLGRAALVQDGPADLLVMVSLSMPRETLERIADQAERAGAKLVFRGLKGDSMRQMSEAIQAIVGGRNVSAVVHPPAFQQFGITRVPAVVIARPAAGSVLDNGCSHAGTFVKVSGDVSLDYALEHIERRSPAWAELAKGFRSKIIRGIN